MALTGHQPIIKGHLGQKSSVLATTSCKLTKQMLVQQHLVAHYKKIQDVKTSIDNSCPKSWFTNAKARDSARKEKLKRPSSARPPSARRPYTADSISQRISARDDMNVPESARSFCNDPEVDAIIRKVLANSNYSAPAPEKSSAPPSQRPLSSGGANYSQSVDSEGRRSYRMPDYAKFGAGNPPHGKADPDFGTYGGDVIDVHADKFTPSQPYTPRTLKREAQSKLGQSNYYYRPKPKKTSTQTKKDNDAEPPSPSAVPHEQNLSENPDPKVPKRTIQAALSPSNAAKPPSKATPSPRTKPSVNVEASISPSAKAAPLLQRSNVMSKRVSSVNPPKESGNQVPSLSIQDDPDKMRWLKQQAEKAELRKEFLGTEPVTYEDRSLFNPVTMDTTKLSDSVSQHVLSSTMQQYKKEEEELMYWNFISDVTNDVLARNIFTNTVLEQVFEDHIQRNRHRLKISKMREMLQKIRVDLGIPASDSQFEDSYGYKSTRPLDINYSVSVSPERPHFEGQSSSPSNDRAFRSSTQEDPLNYVGTTQLESHNTPLSRDDVVKAKPRTRGSLSLPHEEGDYSSTDTYASNDGVHDQERALMCMTMRPSQLKQIMNSEQHKRTYASEPQQASLNSTGTSSIFRADEMDALRCNDPLPKPIPSHFSTPSAHQSSRITGESTTAQESLVDPNGRSVHFAKDNEIISTRESDDVSITDVTSLQTPKLISASMNNKALGMYHRSNSSDTLDASSELGDTYKRQIEEMDNKSNYTDDFEDAD